MDIALLGTGLMGSALAKGLLDTGARVTVWNRTAHKCAALGAAGATVADSPSAAVAAAPIVLISLLDYGVAKSVLAQCDSLAGKAVVNAVTGSPEEANEFSEWVTGRGGRYLDGAISAYPEDIGTENSGINYSGSEEAWSQVRDLLTPIAAQSRFVGTRPGAANVLDAAMAGAFFNVSLGAFHEAAAYVRAEGIPVSEMSHVLHLWTDKLLQLLREALSAFETREYDTDQATLDIYTAAVESWRDSMVRAGQRAALMSANLDNLRAACAAGLGDQGIFAQIETLAAQPTFAE
ncbi:NAD(P)-dependent oxidoreductase [Nocardia sp. NPDC059239]|uniref:NAD(P)-dependent oxidoreductase n=1 Tax=unclassified Nocardia TaxID=2637762 RepID=UPI00367669B9